MQYPENNTHIDSLLHAWRREFRNHAFYMGPAVYDDTLRQHMQQYDTCLHLRFDFTAQGSEVFVPVAYRSATGDPVFAGAAWERLTAGNTIQALTVQRFQELATAYAGTTGQALSSKQLQTEPVIAADGWYSIAALVQTRKEAPLLASLVYSAAGSAPVAESMQRWMEQYIHILLPQFIQHSDTDASGLPEVLIRTDKDGWPDACKLVTGTNREQQYNIHHLLRYFTPLIAIAGRYGLAHERTLISTLYLLLQEYAPQDAKGLLQQLLTARHIECAGQLFTGAAYTVSYPNPLHEHFLLEPIFSPTGQGSVFARYFPKEDITVSIRPFDHNRDMDLVYAWFHAEHAKPIWKMDWPMEQLELFFRTITAHEAAHSFIGEINGEPTFNLEVYWVTRDVLGDYYEVQPDDYGTHLLIAPTDKKKKFPSATMQTILDWLFAQPLIGRLAGEGAVESVAALMNKVHVGFRLDRVLEMPHKRSHLNFCRREWYWEKFPENKNFISTQPTHKTTVHEPAASI